MNRRDRRRAEAQQQAHEARLAQAAMARTTAAKKGTA